MTKEGTGNRIVVRNIFYLFSIQGLNYIIPLVLLPYLLRTLGPDKYGKLALGQAIIQYYILLVDYGFNLISTKKIAICQNNRKAVNEVFWNTMAAKAVLCVIAFILHLILIGTVPLFQENRTVLNMLLLSVIGTVLFPVWYFQGMESLKTLSIINLIVKVALLPVTIWLVKGPNDLLMACFLQSSIYLSSGIVSIVLLLLQKQLYFIRLSMNSVWRYLKEAGSIFLSLVSTNLYTSSFIIILSLYVNAETVGYYSAAEKIMRISCYALIAPAVQAVFPRISSLVAENRANATALLRKTFLITGVLLGMISLGLLLFAKQAISIIGKDYGSSVHLLQIMSFVPVFIGLGGIAGQIGLVAFEGSKKYTRVYLFCGLLSLVLAFSLTNQLHEVGTAIAVSLTELFVCLSMVYCARKNFMLPSKYE